MSDKKIEDIKAAIQSKGYDWKFGKTSVSELSSEAMASRLGLIVSKEELEATAMAIKAETQLESFRGFIAAPSAVDWRNNNGNWTTSIKDQGPCGSCVSFGVVGTIESRLKIVCKDPNRTEDLSEASLQFCGGGSCSGWNFPPALNYAQNTGVCTEADYPYSPMNQPCKQCTPFIKIDSWKQVLTIIDRKNSLATKGPMVGGMAVYQDFMIYTGGVYRRVSNVLKGYHAIVIVGYDDNQRCWICKNSWGTGWGEKGWFKIGYGECMIDKSFAFYEVDLKCPPPPKPPCNVLYLRKVLKLAKMNKAVKAALCFYICRKGPPVILNRTTYIIVRNVWLILRKCPQYREPFCRLLGCKPWWP